MRLSGAPLVCLALLPACEKLDQFDTTGDSAYCGAVVDASFVRTSEANGGFAHGAQLKLHIDTSKLNSSPGDITSKDQGCNGGPTFDGAALRVPPEVLHDPLSSMTFGDGQVQNVIAWVDTSCRGSVLAIVSLLKTDHVDVRLLESGDLAAQGKDVFTLFSLARYDNGCNF